MYISLTKRLLVRDIKGFGIKTYIQMFLEEVDSEAIKNGLKMMKIKTLERANYIKELLNTPNTKFETPFILYKQHYEWPEVDFIPSNLGKGFIFYFICNGCGRKVKYLYEPRENSQYLCRICHGLHYKQPDRRIRRISRLTHKPYLSNDDRKKIMKIAGEDNSLTL